MRSDARVIIRTGMVLGAMMLLGALGGCASVGVKPWDRDLLAQDAMALDANPLEISVDAHIYFSKEASTGGLTSGGGGCGCN